LFPASPFDFQNIAMSPTIISWERAVYCWKKIVFDDKMGEREGNREYSDQWRLQKWKIILRAAACKASAESRQSSLLSRDHGASG
jgi:hypothetical protein